MTNEEFIYWINGYLTLSDDAVVDTEQFRIIRNHVNLVKAIAGNLDNSISAFLYYLEEALIKSGGLLNFNEVINIADSTFNMISGTTSSTKS